MRQVALVSARLQRPDLLQIGGLFLVVLVVALNANWPGSGARVNESWLVVAPLRNSVLALLGLAFGAYHAALPTRSVDAQSGGEDATQPSFHEAREGTRVTWFALLVITLLSWPFELAAQAGSFPATPGYWPAIVAPVTVTGYFGLGLLMGWFLRGPFSGVLLLVCVPATLAGTIWLDFALHTVIANPWAGPLTVAPAYLVCMLGLSVVTLIRTRPATGPRIPPLARRKRTA
ncbi:MAG: hypothetical protein WC972_07005 [Trueperaceae bacterium]